MSKCPLCHNSIAAEDDKDENWRKHLMETGKDACLKNPRREASIKRGQNFNVKYNIGFKKS